MNEEIVANGVKILQLNPKLEGDISSGGCKISTNCMDIECDECPYGGTLTVVKVTRETYELINSLYLAVG